MTPASTSMTSTGLARRTSTLRSQRSLKITSWVSTTIEPTAPVVTDRRSQRSRIYIEGVVWSMKRLPS